MDYQYEQSIYSDSQFLKDNLEETDVQEGKSVLVTDGNYMWPCKMEGQWGDLKNLIIGHYAG